MEKNIADKIEILIKTKVPDNDRLKEFIKANDEYQKLIQEGIAIKRGFNIMTTEEIYSPVSNYICTQSVE